MVAADQPIGRDDEQSLRSRLARYRVVCPPPSGLGTAGKLGASISGIRATKTCNLFFDPNTDGEPNENTEVFGTSIDGYQLAFNQPLGISEINAITQTAGLHSEAHVNALFGNQGRSFSGFAGLEMKQTTSVDENFGYSELFIPWNNFDATDPADGAVDIGLYHPEAPERRRRVVL